MVKKTNLLAFVSVVRIAYRCPWCKEAVGYETDGLPPKGQCNKCLKPLKFKVIYLPK